MKALLTAGAAGLSLATAALAWDATAVIEAENAKFVAAFNAGDADAVAALYTEDGMILPPGGDAVSGRDGIAEFWAAAMESGVAGARLTVDEVHDIGDDTIVEISRYELLDAEGAPVGAGKYMVYWRKVGGDWQLHRDIWN